MLELLWKDPLTEKKRIKLFAFFRAADDGEHQKVNIASPQSEEKKSQN